jgi:hypothetical protein
VRLWILEEGIEHWIDIREEKRMRNEWHKHVIIPHPLDTHILYIPYSLSPPKKTCRLPFLFDCASLCAGHGWIICKWVCATFFVPQKHSLKLYSAKKGRKYGELFSLLLLSLKYVHNQVYIRKSVREKMSISVKMIPYRTNIDTYTITCKREVLSIAIIAPKQSWKKKAKRNRKWTSIFITLSVSYLAYLSYINNQNQNGNVRRMKIKGNRVNMIPIREIENTKIPIFVHWA